VRGRDARATAGLETGRYKYRERRYNLRVALQITCLVCLPFHSSYGPWKSSMPSSW